MGLRDAIPPVQYRCSKTHLDERRNPIYLNYGPANDALNT